MYKTIHIRSSLLCNSPHCRTIPRLQQTIFFIDRCLGKHPILEKLREAGISVEIHDDHFLPNTLDADWIPKIGEWGWVILTKDARIARNTLERQAVARAEIRMFTLADM